ncbi:hypothetical protein [Streptomyces chartreusis]|uniref:hypothetical protein n=1 Tax=Streptomyces chartreusis TaxID=1969 RepID=UPI00363DC2DD
MLTTRYDEVVTPYTSAYPDAAPIVTDVKLQDVCPAESPTTSASATTTWQDVQS